jgi:aminomethyltransferase
MSTFKKTPLFEEHQKLHAQMAPFGSWEMPIQYESILAEHKHCREAVSVFDICHMGEFYFQGDLQKTRLNQLTSMELSKIPEGRCKYGFFLSEKGTIHDDCIIYRLSNNELMIVVNSETTEMDFALLKAFSGTEETLQDISYETAKLDIQGPLSRDILSERLEKKIAELPYFGFQKMELFGVQAIVSRTGYTGELGYEIYLHRDKIFELWNLLLSQKEVKPAGLGARDILRLEMGYCLYGSDIDEKTTPIEAGLGVFLDWNKEFLGKQALLTQKKHGVTQARVGFKSLSRRAPRSHYQIFADGMDVGQVTSGAFSPMLSSGIGMGYVNPEFSQIGTRLLLKQDNIEIETEVTELPFYKGGSLRK